jgi:hypothetical protein
MAIIAPASPRPAMSPPRPALNGTATLVCKVATPVWLVTPGVLAACPAGTTVTYVTVLLAPPGKVVV